MSENCMLVRKLYAYMISLGNYKHMLSLKIACLLGNYKHESCMFAKKL